MPVRQRNFVSAGELLLQLADLRTVQLRAFVDEPDIARLAIGDPIEITWDASPGRIWQTKVTTIPSTVTPRGSRNVGETTSIVDNKEFKLLPNVNVGVTIVAAEHDNVLVVPREAVRNDESKPYVLLIVGHEFKRREVETALSRSHRGGSLVAADCPPTIWWLSGRSTANLSPTECRSSSKL